MVIIPKWVVDGIVLSTLYSQTFQVTELWWFTHDKKTIERDIFEFFFARHGTLGSIVFSHFSDIPVKTLKKHSNIYIIHIHAYIHNIYENGLIVSELVSSRQENLILRNAFGPLVSLKQPSARPYGRTQNPDTCLVTWCVLATGSEMWNG